jgi:hypothetical protein
MGVNKKKLRLNNEPDPVGRNHLGGHAELATAAGLVFPLLEGAVVVAPLVFHQMVGADETAGADGAGEFLLAGVHPPVAGQLVRSGKLLVASIHGAGVGSFT